MSRKRLISTILDSSVHKPINEKFVADFRNAIEKRQQNNSHIPSEWYKPSSLNCLRQMYFMRTKTDIDNTIEEYNSIGMADTGTRRHVAIQSVLTDMKDLGYDWEYIDVEDYLNNKHNNGECLNVKFVSKQGMETKLFDDVYKLMFLCDGIVKDLTTGEYYLFEFKNQVSFKAKDKKKIDDAHVNQVTAYCAELGLNKALVLYENRDTCILCCPEVFIVTDEMKSNFYARLLECEDFVEHLRVPPKTDDSKTCTWCRYKTMCRKVGN